MTVRDLIAQLQKFEPNRKIYVRDKSFGMFGVSEDAVIEYENRRIPEVVEDGYSLIIRPRD